MRSVAILFAAMMLSFSASAVTKGKDTPLEKQLAKELKQNGKGIEGVVYAHFTVDDEGHIDIMEIDSSDQSLLDFAKERLERLVVKITDPGDEHRLHFIFKNQD